MTSTAPSRRRDASLDTFVATEVQNAVDPQRHAELSARRRGGRPSDYHALHSFFDQTKELCSDHHHRLLHNLWGIRRVVLPIFGPTLALSRAARRCG